MGRQFLDLVNFFKGLFKEKPCTCHGCIPVETNNSRSPIVSHGLKMWVRDGKIHYRKKSKIVGLFE